MLFEKKEYSDGGPNDKGVLIGYIEANSREEAENILNVNHGFIQIHEISQEVYENRKRDAENTLQMYL